MRNRSVNSREPLQLLALVLPLLAAYLVGQGRGEHVLSSVVVAGAVCAGVFLVVFLITRLVVARD